MGDGGIYVSTRCEDLEESVRLGFYCIKCVRLLFNRKGLGVNGVVSRV